MKEKLGPEEIRRKLREIRLSLSGIPDQKLPAEAILQTLAELRESLPATAGPRRSSASEGRSRLPHNMPVETEEDFEYAAVVDALESFIADADAVVEQAHGGIL